MRNAGLEEAQAGIKIAGRNINNLRYADDTTLMAEREEEPKSFLMKVKERWKSWLQTQYSENKDHGIWSHHFMANRWGNNGNSERIYFLGLKRSFIYFIYFSQRSWTWRKQISTHPHTCIHSPTDSPPMHTLILLFFSFENAIQFYI